MTAHKKAPALQKDECLERFATVRRARIASNGQPPAWTLRVQPDIRTYNCRKGRNIFLQNNSIHG